MGHPKETDTGQQQFILECAEHLWAFCGCFPGLVPHMLPRWVRVQHVGWGVLMVTVKKEGRRAWGGAGGGEKPPVSLEFFSFQMEALPSPLKEILY